MSTFIEAGRRERFEANDGSNSSVGFLLQLNSTATTESSNDKLEQPLLHTQEPCCAKWEMAHGPIGPARLMNNNQMGQSM